MGKYDIAYYKCPSCGFIQTEKVFWLAEAYEGVIADTDIGYVARNLRFSVLADRIIRISYPEKGRFLDYGGGYGLFVRLMRDRGLDFYRQDLYCENIFAKGFDVEDLLTERTERIDHMERTEQIDLTERKERIKHIDLKERIQHIDLKERAGAGRFVLLTSFEVFEHLDDPMDEIEKMFGYADSILFSTELQPSRPLTNIDDWWYFAPHMGQHIALYGLRTLEKIAEKMSCHLYSDGKAVHLLTRKKLLFNTVKWVSLVGRATDRILGRHFQNRKSLLQKDYQSVHRGITGQE